MEINTTVDQNTKKIIDYIGSVSTATVPQCSGPAGLSFNITFGDFPWRLNAVAYNAGSGITHGTITGLHAVLTGPACSLIIDGTGPGKDNGTVSYSNTKHALTWLKGGSGNLHLYKVLAGGCAGLFHSGDAATLTGTSSVTPAQTITSP